MPARIAFCCVDAGVRPRTLAARKAVVVLARTLSFLSSLAVQAFPWLEGRRPIEVSRVDGLELTMIHPDMTDCLSERIDKVTRVQTALDLNRAKQTRNWRGITGTGAVERRQSTD
jgi:hypothetical protein